MTSAVQSVSAGYRGVDRRMRSRAAASPGGLPVGRGALVLLALVVPTAVLAWRHPGWALVVEDLRPVLRSALMTGAGLLCLVHWRVSGRTRPALVGVALLVLGVLTESVVQLSPVLPVVAEQQLPDVLLRLAPALVAAALLVWSSRTHEVDTTAHPVRLMVVVAVLVPAGCAVVVLLARQLGLPASTALVAAAAAWRVGLWLAVAVAAGRSRAGGEPWLVVVLALLTLTALADAVAVFVPQPAGAVAAGLAAATGAAAVLGASRDVRECLLAQSQDLHRLSLDVSDSRRREQWAQAEHEERLHDVRSVLAGIHGATATLQRYEDRLDPGVRRRLEQAVTAELHRLEHLVDPSPVEGSVSDLDVEAVLEPVLLTERQQGAAIRADLRGVSVRADAADLATIVCALLVNARRHAAGSPVVVRAETRRGETQLRVEDAGPGVPLHLRESVFERGERGEATAPGSGLGLYTARRLATAAGGTLHVEPRSQGGASFVLTLPAGSLHAARPRVRQDGAQRDEVGDAVGGVDGVTLPRQRDHGAGPDVLLAPGADDGDVVADR